MRPRIALGRAMVFVATSVATVSMLAPPAQAKLLYLEVQITEGERTVRIAPKDFVRQISDGTPSGLYGFEDVASPSSIPETSPLNIRYMMYDPYSSSFGPGVDRETYVVLSYYRTESGAIGRVLPGGDEKLFSDGQWVRFTPDFTAMVDEALQTLPAVAAVAPPPHVTEPTGVEGLYHQVRRNALIFGLIFLVVMALITTLVLWSGRSARRAELEMQRGNATPA